MEGPHTKIRPLSELVIPVEASFNDFVEKHGGELVRNLIQNINPAKNADYVFRSPLVIGELKCIERTAFTEEDGKKLNELAAKWVRVGLIPPFYGRIQIELRNLPAPCQQDMLKALQAPWKNKLAAANKQIKRTKVTLEMPDACGVLFLVNDAPSWIQPYDAMNLITRVLQAKKDDGRNVYSHLDWIVYFSVNARVIKDGKGWNFWLPGYRTKSEPNISAFLDQLRDAWFEFHSKLIRLDKEVFQVRSGTEGLL